MLQLRIAYGFVLVLLLSGCAMLRAATEPDFDVLNYQWPTPAPVVWRTPTPGDNTLATTAKSVLVVADRNAQQPEVAATIPNVMVALLRHFRAGAHWVYADDLTAQEIGASQAVVYIGDNAQSALTSRTLHLLSRVKRLVWVGYHLDAVHRSGIAFGEIEPTGVPQTVRKAATLHYRRHAYPVRGPATFVGVRLRRPANVLAHVRSGSMRVPLLIEDRGNYAFTGVDGLDLNAPSSVRRLSLLALADALNDVLGVPAKQDAHAAILCLEGVSAQTAPNKLAAIVGSLYRRGVPYAIAFTPGTRTDGGPFKESPYLLRVLLWAQLHGATLVLHTPRRHGPSQSDFTPVADTKVEPLHSAFDRYAPRSADEAEAGSLIADMLEYASRIGLHPVIWETPYGAAGLADDVVAATFFGTTWQRRAPAASVPWVVENDANGQLLLPAYFEDSSDGKPPSVARQIDAARTLLICRGCTATGFLPVATVSPKSVEHYADSLRAMGYAFIDPGVFVRSPGRGADAYALPPQKRLPRRLLEARVP